MNFESIKKLIVARFGESICAHTDATALQPSITILAEHIAELCAFLKNDAQLFFDQLSCLTAIDNGPDAATIEVLYHLNSIVFEHQIVLKISIPRGTTEALPQVPSVSTVWRTADWHEREAYDLVGIAFEHHPDLRRILMPNDWQGHPLRKDYQPQETYHGITVAYEQVEGRE